MGNSFVWQAKTASRYAKKTLSTSELPLGFLTIGVARFDTGESKSDIFIAPTFGDDGIFSPFCGAVPPAEVLIIHQLASRLDGVDFAFAGRKDIGELIPTSANLFRAVPRLLKALRVILRYSRGV